MNDDTNKDWPPALGMNRRELCRRLSWSLAGLGLCGCGGGAASPVALAPATPSPPSPTPSATAPPSPLPGTRLTSLQVQSSSAGTFPYVATVLPTRGQLPQGLTLESPDDGALKASILSTHDDGSAAVVVVAGSTTVTANQLKTLNLQSVIAGTASALTPAAIGSAVQSVAIDLGTYGSISITDFSTPERIWWSNGQTICARYRRAAPAPASTALEVVIDIHAFADGRALVEVVVENGKMNTASPVKPAAANYSNATVKVNGTVIQTVNSAAMPLEGAHSAFRAWYASSWVGGDPGLRVTQLHTDLQAHPLLFKCDQACTYNLNTYASDTYTPWGNLRQSAVGMGGAGDHDFIGPLPKWDAHALQSGDYRAWNATEQNTLAVLGFNVNYRDSGTGLVPTATQLATKSQQSNWPSQGSEGGPMIWELAHHPAAGLMAFISRPSPVFIEIAQKVSVWNCTWSTGYGYPLGGWSQARGLAWGLRSIAHAYFATPDSLGYKAAAKDWITGVVTYVTTTYKDDVRNSLGIIWSEYGTYPSDQNGGQEGFQTSLWMNQYFITEVAKVANLKCLSTTPQAALDTLADWACKQPVRWINEQTNGGWRFVPYHTTVGTTVATITMQPTWNLAMADAYTDSPPGVSGAWMTHGGDPTTYASFTANTASGAFYPSYFWSALVAAVERGVPGAATAWSTVQSNITNLSSWRAGFGTDPRWGSTPRKA